MILCIYYYFGTHQDIIAYYYWTIQFAMNSDSGIVANFQIWGKTRPGLDINIVPTAIHNSPEPSPA